MASYITLPSSKAIELCNNTIKAIEDNRARLKKAQIDCMRRKYQLSLWRKLFGLGVPSDEVLEARFEAMQNGSTYERCLYYSIAKYESDMYDICMDVLTCAKAVEQVHLTMDDYIQISWYEAE